MFELKEHTFYDLLDGPVRNGIYKEKEYHGKGAKIVNMGELFSYPRLKDVCMKRVQLNDKEREKFLLKEGDLLFARRSLTAEGAGKCSIVKEIKEDTTFESSIIRARFDPARANSDFIYYYFNSPYGKYLIGSILRQVAVSGITGGDLMELKLEIPCVQEQGLIAEMLSSLDDKIDLLHRNNRTLEQIAEALFRQWFMEEFAKTVRLGDYIKTTSGGTPQREREEYYFGGTIPWVKSKELNENFILETEERITEAGLSNSSAKKLPKFSVLIAMYGATVGEFGVLSEQATCNQAICALLPNEQFPYTFLYSFIKASKDNLINLAVGSAQQNISQLLIQNLDIPEPSDKIKSFHAYMEPLFKKKLSNEIQARTLKKTRDNILPKLMSGEVRIEL